MSWSGAVWYGHPSRKMLVIGVTGTTGKSTVVEMLAAVFQSAGKKVGIASTIRFQIADTTWNNNEKMTMLGRWKLQHMLRRMVDAGCTVAIIETTSQGLAQNRHIGVEYDCALITNLSPEHIESHGSFAAYKAAKEKLFACIAHTYRKLGTPKISVVNLAMADAQEFLVNEATRHIGFALHNVPQQNLDAVLVPDSISQTEEGSTFRLAGTQYTLALPGEYNVANALAAIAVGQAYGLSHATMSDGLKKVKGVPGRFEVVVQKPFRVVVDYAFVPEAMHAVYKAAQAFRPRHIIAVLGAAGGGRDKWKRPVLGKIAAQYAKFVIVTNEDPYDEDPMRIIDQVADGACDGGKVDGETLFRVGDRKEGIAKALSLAQEGDLVMITGKGSEEVMVVAGGKKVPFNDAAVVRELTSTARSASDPSSPPLEKGRNGGVRGGVA